MYVVKVKLSTMNGYIHILPLILLYRAWSSNQSYIKCFRSILAVIPSYIITVQSYFITAKYIQNAGDNLTANIHIQTLFHCKWKYIFITEYLSTSLVWQTYIFRCCYIHNVFNGCRRCCENSCISAERSWKGLLYRLIGIPDTFH